MASAQPSLVSAEPSTGSAEPPIASPQPTMPVGQQAYANQSRMSAHVQQDSAPLPPWVCRKRNMVTPQTAGLPQPTPSTSFTTASEQTFQTCREEGRRHAYTPRCAGMDGGALLARAVVAQLLLLEPGLGAHKPNTKDRCVHVCVCVRDVCVCGHLALRTSVTRLTPAHDTCRRALPNPASPRCAAPCGSTMTMCLTILL